MVPTKIAATSSAAAKRQPQHRAPDRRGKMPSDGRGSGHEVLHIVKQIAHFPFSRGYAYDARMA